MDTKKVTIAEIYDAAERGDIASAEPAIGAEIRFRHADITTEKPAQGFIRAGDEVHVKGYSIGTIPGFTVRLLRSHPDGTWTGVVIARKGIPA